MEQNPLTSVLPSPTLLKDILEEDTGSKCNAVWGEVCPNLATVTVFHGFGMGYRTTPRCDHHLMKDMDWNHDGMLKYLIVEYIKIIQKRGTRLIINLDN